MVAAAMGAELKPASTGFTLKLACQIAVGGTLDKTIGAGAAHQV